MTIPKGVAYKFIITVVEKDSFLPQDLTSMDVANSTFKLHSIDTLVNVVIGTTTLERLVPYTEGKVLVSLDSGLTSSLFSARGDAVDGYYLKPTYQGVINIKFTDTTPERTAIIDKVYVAPTGS